MVEWVDNLREKLCVLADVLRKKQGLVKEEMNKGYNSKAVCKEFDAVILLSVSLLVEPPCPYSYCTIQISSSLEGPAVGGGSLSIRLPVSMICSVSTTYPISQHTTSLNSLKRVCS